MLSFASVSRWLASRIRQTPRHSAVVRVTHWLTVIAFFALLVSGLEIVVSHPRFYWGETGNVNMRPLFTIPIPASRDTVPTGYGYMMPDQNGWSRYLHFQAAWVLVLTALVYGIWGLCDGTLAQEPVPARGEWRLGRVVARDVEVSAAHAAGGTEHSYNVVQRSAYLVVIFVLFPAVIWTGLALSPSFDSAFPWFVDVLGGRQSARTLHFFLTWLLVRFLVVHVTMIIWGILEADAGDDYRCARDRRVRRLQRRGGPVMNDFAAQIDHRRLAAAAGFAGLRWASRWRDEGWCRQITADLWAGRDAGLCGAEDFDEARAGAGVSAQHDFEDAVCELLSPPTNDAFKRLQAGGFQDWRLTVDGMVARPGTFSLADLRTMPVRSQITEVACEEGWSYIAEWIGTPLIEVLREVGALPQARYVVYFSIDSDWWESDRHGGCVASADAADAGDE